MRKQKRDDSHNAVLQLYVT